jgi:hypothetical protein
LNELDSKLAGSLIALNHCTQRKAYLGQIEILIPEALEAFCHGDYYFFRIVPYDGCERFRKPIEENRTRFATE